MPRKSLARKAALAAGMAAIAGALFAQPAFAAQSDVYYHGTHASADTSPGNGAPGWVWVYGSTESGSLGGSVNYQYWDGSTHKLSVGRGASASMNTSASIKGFQACWSYRVEGYDFESCSAWHYFG